MLLNLLRLTSTVTICGSDDAREAAANLISQKIAEMSAARSPRILQPSEFAECQLCFTDPEDYSLVLCGHKCCRGCLQRMFTMFSRPDSEIKFQIKCPINASCSEIVASSDIRACCDFSVFANICLESTKRFIESSGDYRFCFSANCNGIVPDTVAKRGFVRCSSCAGEFCSSCCGKDDIRGVPWHKKLTCAQFISLQKDGGETLLQQFLSTSGGRACLKCNNFVIRTVGCDHMTCICRHNFCYQCGADSSRSVCQRPCPGGSLR